MSLCTTSAAGRIASCRATRPAAASSSSASAFFGARPIVALARRATSTWPVGRAGFAIRAAVADGDGEKKPDAEKKPAKAKKVVKAANDEDTKPAEKAAPKAASKEAAAPKAAAEEAAPAPEAKKVVAAAAAAVADKVKEAMPEPDSVGVSMACPICFRPMKGLSCSSCKRTFADKGAYMDLTVEAGASTNVYEEKRWTGTTLFETEAVSYAYERGWRQSFSWAGFPGEAQEFDLAMKYLAPSLGGNLLDASCGSGLFSRRFASSGKFANTVAMDFSENMLKQCSDFTGKDKSITPGTLQLVRADIARLPFETGSLDAVHAGAAIHCWPNPQLAVAEISRVLKPGGVWVASTFLLPSAPLGEIFGDANVRPLTQFLNQTGIASASYKFWEEQELKDLATQAGLVGWERTRTRQFIMFTCRKPLEE